MGFFSSDRAVNEYAEKIWHLKPFKAWKNHILTIIVENK
jgi:hypothetical protein